MDYPKLRYTFGFSEREVKMSKFDSDFAFSEKMAKVADGLYRSLFSVDKIIRFSRKDTPHILDKEFHIDVILESKSGLRFTLQEKIRRHDALMYDDFTLEKLSNRYNETLGEYYFLCTDFYTYAWANRSETDFARVRIFKVPDVKLAIDIGQIYPSKERMNISHGGATFLPYPFSSFDDEWFIFKKG